MRGGYLWLQFRIKGMLSWGEEVRGGYQWLLFRMRGCHLSMGYKVGRGDRRISKLRGGQLRRREVRGWSLRGVYLRLMEERGRGSLLLGEEVRGRNLKMRKSINE